MMPGGPPTCRSRIRRPPPRSPGPTRKLTPRTACTRPPWRSRRAGPRPAAAGRSSERLEQLARGAQAGRGVARQHAQQLVEKGPAGLVHDQVVSEDADRLLRIEDRAQPLERGGLADEQPRAAPVDRIEMGVDLLSPGRASARRPNVDRPQKPQAPSCSTSTGSTRFQGAPAPPGSRRRRPRARRRGPGRARSGSPPGPACRLDRLAAGRRMVGVGIAVLQDGRVRASGNRRLDPGLEPQRHDRQRHRQRAALGKVQQALEGRVGRRRRRRATTGGSPRRAPRSHRASSRARASRSLARLRRGRRRRAPRPDGRWSSAVEIERRPVARRGNFAA